MSFELLRKGRRSAWSACSREGRSSARAGREYFAEEEERGTPRPGQAELKLDRKLFSPVLFAMCKHCGVCSVWEYALNFLTVVPRSPMQSCQKRGLFKSIIIRGKMMTDDYGHIVVTGDSFMFRVSSLITSAFSPIHSIYPLQHCGACGVRGPRVRAPLQNVSAFLYF